MNDHSAAIRFEKTETGGRYFVALPNGEEARLTFVDAGRGRIVADHTFVPVAYRQDGIAEAMAGRLFADARAQGLAIEPACWFIDDEFKRLSPRWDDIWAR